MESNLLFNINTSRTYRFKQDDNSNSGHPYKILLKADKTTQYTTNVTTNGTAGSSGAYTQIVVSDETPVVLHYQCGVMVIWAMPLRIIVMLLIQIDAANHS